MTAAYAYTSDVADFRAPVRRPAIVQWEDVTSLTGAAPWLGPSLKVVASLSRLAPNWDGYGSPAVRRTALESVRQFLKAIESFELEQPEIFPVTGGGIGITFQAGQKELEIEVLPDGTMRFLKDSGAGEEPVEFRIGTGFHLGLTPYAHHFGDWLSYAE